MEDEAQVFIQKSEVWNCDGTFTCRETSIVINPFSAVGFSLQVVVVSWGEQNCSTVVAYDRRISTEIIGQWQAYIRKLHPVSQTQLSSSEALTVIRWLRIETDTGCIFRKKRLCVSLSSQSVLLFNFCNVTLSHRWVNLGYFFVMGKIICLYFFLHIQVQMVYFWWFF